jgi:hypothetical protein
MVFGKLRRRADVDDGIELVEPVEPTEKGAGWADTFEPID